ncbi:MAG: hypothetical protein H7222_12330 [Methylotenera sp.]|nr:hypothetical protein [Oligoflexia bacterium]
MRSVNKTVFGSRFIVFTLATLSLTLASVNATSSAQACEVKQCSQKECTGQECNAESCKKGSGKSKQCKHHPHQEETAPAAAAQPAAPAKT